MTTRRHQGCPADNGKLFFLLTDLRHIYIKRIGVVLRDMYVERVGVHVRRMYVHKVGRVKLYVGSSKMRYAYVLCTVIGKRREAKK